MKNALLKVDKRVKAPKLSVTKITKPGKKIGGGKAPVLETMDDYMKRMNKSGTP